jgi:D-beta-D-heptose 7-phosphate kinase/D-beta-D-heptose 1-phosphate adenosyltransferase
MEGAMSGRLSTCSGGESRRLAEICDRFAGVRVLVVGDVMLDRYFQGTVNRVSPEAPVPVVRVEREWASPGGAGHVAASLAGLGCQVALAGVVGADRTGHQLRESLVAAGVGMLLLAQAPDSTTLTKARVLAAGHHQLLRLDHEPRPEQWALAAAELLRWVQPRVAEFDAIILSDYEKGALTRPVLQEILGEGRRLGRITLVDPKKVDLTAYRGATLLTPNVAETGRAVGRALHTDEEYAEVAASLREQLDLEATLITRGAHGMTGVDEQGPFHVRAKVRQVADVTGAGDTVVSVLAATLAQRVPLRLACELASEAAGLAVSNPGTYVVRGEELRTAVSGLSTKVLSWQAARQQVELARKQGKRIVFTNGCFDILHAGHLHNLEQSRRLGDFLVVGLNSDASVRGIKGPGRPVVVQGHRAALLAGLACVDAVVLFEETTPEELVRRLEPDVLVKGGDYDIANIAGGSFVRQRGGEVVTLPLVDGLSTTSILKKAEHADAVEALL